MAQTSDDDLDEEITGINVTPLVDVMLVLLIIFMVTATYIVNQSINISLPQASSANEVPQENIALVLDKDSNLFLNGKAIAFADLSASIVELKAANKNANPQALIAADQATPHGSVVRLIDAVRKGGITDFAINVEVEEQQ